AHTGDGPDQMIDQITPMRRHIEDEAAAFRLLVVPARTLTGLLAAVEYPPAEIDTRMEHAAEKAALFQALQFQHARQKQLVLHDAGATILARRQPRELERLIERVRQRL